MNAMTISGQKPGLGIRARIVSTMKQANDLDVKSLLRDVLCYLDSPYDLSWMQAEYRLSPGEFKVLGLLVDGHTPKQIAEITGTQVSTVRVQISRCYNKCRVTNMAELTALLLQRAKGG
jgi:DNA-binding NarL/FixJ family response regulator